MRSTQTMMNDKCEICSIANNYLTGQSGRPEMISNRHSKNMRAFDRHQHIYYEGDSCNYIYSVHSGSCKEYSLNSAGKEYIKDFYMPGDIIGLEALTAKSYKFSLLALEPLCLCAIPVDYLLNAIARAPDLSLRLLNVFCRIIQNHGSIRLSSSAKQRVADFLLNFSERMHLRGQSADEFVLPIAHQEISHKIGIAIETLSRVFTYLQKREVIKINLRTVHIIDFDALKEISGGLS